MSLEDLKQDISTVIAKSYTLESLADFFQKYTFLGIFEILHNEGSDLNEQFLSRFSNFMATIFQYEKYADQFLFENTPESKQLLVYILTHKEVEIRQLIPRAIIHHVPKITAVLEQANDQILEEYLGTLFRQLDDETTEVGFKALNVLLKIVKESRNSGYSIAKRDTFINYLEKGLKNINSVVMMRYIDLLIEVTNQSEELFDLYRTRGLMELIVKAYQTNDVLVKLTVVEAIPKMGDSAWNSKYVNETLVQQSMLDECFDENTDFYIRKNIAVLIAKLIARGLLPMNMKMKGLFSTMFKTWLQSGFKEELYGVLEIISSLVVRQSGVEVLFSSEEVQIAFFSLALKTDQTLKTKFLFAYSQIFSEEIDKKLSAYMKKAFALIGHIEAVASMKKEMAEIPTTSFDLSFKWLLKILHIPFVEIELEALNVLRNVLRFEWSIMDFAKQDNSLYYLTEHISKSKEILDVKREIIREVVEKIEHSQTKDIFLHEFKNKLIAGRQNIKKLSDMNIATDVI